MNIFTIIYLISSVFFTSFGIGFIIESLVKNKKYILMGVISIIFIILNSVILFLCILISIK